MKKTQKQIVKDKLREEGSISNFWAFNNYILRLASIISTLRKEGWNILTKYDGKVGDKNCTYILVDRPKKTIRVAEEIDGVARIVKKEIYES